MESFLNSKDNIEFISIHSNMKLQLDELLLSEEDLDEYVYIFLLHQET